MVMKQITDRFFVAYDDDDGTVGRWFNMLTIDRGRRTCSEISLMEKDARKLKDALEEWLK